MKHVRSPKAAVGLALGVCAAAAFATADGPDFFVVRDVGAGDVLSIRAEPNANARKVGTIPANGTCIRNLGCKGGLTFQEFTTLTPEQQKQRQRQKPRWCRVEYLGVTGWVAGRYLGEGNCQR
ncbi:MAG: SH3 domain-containing protein [Rubrivivax sp.]|nr:SH3 domain-containing protein [Rubrivivax sp.]